MSTLRDVQIPENMDREQQQQQQVMEPVQVFKGQTTKNIWGPKYNQLNLHFLFSALSESKTLLLLFQLVQ